MQSDCKLQAPNSFHLHLIWQNIFKMLCIYHLSPRHNRNISTQHIPTLLAQHLQAPAFERIESQHCWEQHDARVWPPCCNMLQHRTSAHAQAQHCCTNLAKQLQHHATSTNVAWKIWLFSNLSQQHPTCLNTLQWWPNAWNMLYPTMLRYVALKCCDHLARALRCSCQY